MNKIVNGKLVPLTEEEIVQREIDAVKAQEEQSKQVVQDEINTNKKYLSDTDWFYIRRLDTGEEVPVDTVAERAAARAKINQLEGEL